jgi:hypothetical protein
MDMQIESEFIAVLFGDSYKNDDVVIDLCRKFMDENPKWKDLMHKRQLYLLQQKAKTDEEEDPIWFQGFKLSSK